MLFLRKASTGLLYPYTEQRSKKPGFVVVEDPVLANGKKASEHYNNGAPRPLNTANRTPVAVNEIPVISPPEVVKAAVTTPAYSNALDADALATLLPSDDVVEPFVGVREMAPGETQRKRVNTGFPRKKAG